MKFGIVQGRLSKTVKNQLQHYPDDWKREFDILKYSGLSYIELFTNKKKIEPLWNNKKHNLLRAQTRKTKINYHILCDNLLLDKEIFTTKSIKYLLELVDLCLLVNVKLLIIPISKKNTNKNKMKKFISTIEYLLDYSKIKKIKISFEFEQSLIDIKNILTYFKKNNLFGVTFDTGNEFLKYKNISKTFTLNYSFVNHVHLKDRNENFENVIFGTGIIDFKKFFKSLKKKNYKKLCTFETHRGNDPVTTAKENNKFVSKILLNLK